IEALEILGSTDTIDLVITDQVMPHMTGLQLVDAIGQQWPQISVLLATGYAELEPDVALRVPKLGKPFSQSQLAAQVAKLGIKPRNGGQILRFRGNGND
ncbi:MAG TPA: response regulator, partial [Pseudolabrys sp.]